MAVLQLKVALLSAASSVLLAFSSFYLSFLLQQRFYGLVYEPHFIDLNSRRFLDKNARYLARIYQTRKEPSLAAPKPPAGSRERVLSDTSEQKVTHHYANGPESMFFYQRAEEMPYACLCSAKTDKDMQSTSDKSEVLCKNQSIDKLKKNSYCYYAS